VWRAKQAQVAAYENKHLSLILLPFFAYFSISPTAQVARPSSSAWLKRKGKLLRLPTDDGASVVLRTHPEGGYCAVEISMTLKSHPEFRCAWGFTVVLYRRSLTKRTSQHHRGWNRTSHNGRWDCGDKPRITPSLVHASPTAAADVTGLGSTIQAFIFNC
jgi:hypothetical protein